MLPGLLIPRPPQGAAPQEQEEREQTRRRSATRSTMDVAPEGGRFEDEGVTTEENRGCTLATPPQIQGPLELSTPIAEPVQTDEGFAPYDGPDTRVLESEGRERSRTSHQTVSGRIKTAQLPTRGRIRYVPPEGYRPNQPLPRGEGGGYIDRFGNEWVRGDSRTQGQPFEWDVQLSRQGRSQLGWASRDNQHVNVSLDGHITH